MPLFSFGIRNRNAGSNANTGALIHLNRAWAKQADGGAKQSTRSGGLV